MKKRLCIWILEDDDSTCFMYDQILALRYELRFWRKLSQLREALEEKKPEVDLLIADLRLPDESFLSFLESGACQKALKEIPFLVVSSSEDMDSFRQSYSFGAMDYIRKPFGVNELLAKVERCMQSLKT